MHNLDKAQFYAILDTAYVARDKLLEKYKALIQGGSDIIQLRAKKESHDERKAILDEIMPEYEKHQVPLIINDDIELCLSYPGLGLHVGQDDAAVESAREAIGHDRILGLSTHSEEQAQGAVKRAELLNYFAVGPVFATQTKPDYIPVGTELVQYVANMNPPLPFFVIGGINRKTVSQVVEAGAKRVVAVSDMLCDDDTAGAVREIKSLI